MPDIDELQGRPRGPDDRILPSGDEAGTAPGDRGYRPDIEGLRAVAIILVVLLHCGVPRMAGGIVGVDVFFVISGFVITGLLLREYKSSNRIAFLNFYARRARRLLPAALLVIVASLLLTSLIAGHSVAVQVASDCRWSAAFLANFHLTTVTPNVLQMQETPVAGYWSLAVEEQFYLLYPALFAMLMIIPGRWSTRVRLSLGLVVIIIGSLALSIHLSHPGQFAGFNSPLTRAWELAVGGLVAASTGGLQKIPASVATFATWIGLLLIIASSMTLSMALPYPGYAAGLPVLGATLVIGGGCAVPRHGAESLLRITPFAWIGRWSYSWYLWHLAVFFLVAQVLHTRVEDLAITTRLGLALASLLIAATTYFFIENPIRHSTRLADNPKATIAGAGLLIGSCVALTYAF